jgi:dephospho-CoA kinase
MIIGITGTIGSGKGTAVAYLKSKGFSHYSSSAALKEILAERGLPATRDHFSPLAQEIRAADEAGVPKLAHKRMLEEVPDHAIFEALHSVGEAEFVRSIGGVIIGVDADPHVRYERSVGRGEEKDQVTFEEFLKHSRREDEGAEGSGHNIREVINMADAVVQNDGSLEDLHRQLDAILARFDHSGL